MTLLAVALGGALGAVCRYLVDFTITERLAGAFPWGTWTVNISGSFLLGVLAGMTAGTGHTQIWKTAASGGFLGSYTTFSTFTYETLQLAERRAWWEVAWNLASLLAGVAAAGVGWWLST